MPQLDIAGRSLGTISTTVSCFLCELTLFSFIFSALTAVILQSSKIANIGMAQKDAIKGRTSCVTKKDPIFSFWSLQYTLRQDTGKTSTRNISLNADIIAETLGLKCHMTRIQTA